MVVVIYITNKIVYSFPTSVCKEVYDVQVYLYTTTNYSTHFTGADPGFPTRKGWGSGWYIVMEHALVGRYYVGGSGGGGMQEEGAGGRGEGKGGGGGGGSDVMK